MERQQPVGFFDSGLGGISVLREAVRLLPHENYLYYGDAANAPYGLKKAEEVRTLTHAAAEHLLCAGAKAIVVACNTATSAAIEMLRADYPDIPIIGTEPAIKPAVKAFPGGRILMLATPMTVQEKKFRDLKRRYDEQAEIIPVACGGLMEFVERGELSGANLERYLFELLEPYLKVPVDCVVLGCTHYPFLKAAIRKIVGRGVEMMDGSHGVALRLQSRLKQKGLLNTQTENGTARFESSAMSEETENLCKFLLTCRDESGEK